MRYLMHLSRTVKGFKKTFIRSITATDNIMCDVDETPAVVRPDLDEVARALPHFYRAAFDDDACTMSRGIARWAPYTFTLLSTRGTYLNTIYIQPLYKEVGLD